MAIRSDVVEAEEWHGTAPDQEERGHLAFSHWRLGPDPLPVIPHCYAKFSITQNVIFRYWITVFRRP